MAIKKLALNKETIDRLDDDHKQLPVGPTIGPGCPATMLCKTSLCRATKKGKFCDFVHFSKDYNNKHCDINTLKDEGCFTYTWFKCED